MRCPVSGKEHRISNIIPEKINLVLLMNNPTNNRHVINIKGEIINGKILWK